MTQPMRAPRDLPESYARFPPDLAVRALRALFNTCPVLPLSIDHKRKTEEENAVVRVTVCSLYAAASGGPCSGVPATGGSARSSNGTTLRTSLRSLRVCVWGELRSYADAHDFWGGI